MARYQEAVSVVVNIRFGGSDSELLDDYLKDKEDLFSEAQEICALLYEKTKDKSYLKLQMEFQEIYKNEVMKGAAAAAGPEFEDSKKAELFDTLTGATARKKKLETDPSPDQRGLGKGKSGQGQGRGSKAAPGQIGAGGGSGRDRVKKAGTRPLNLFWPSGRRNTRPTAPFLTARPRWISIRFKPG